MCTCMSVSNTFVLFWKIREHLEKKGLEDITWGILMTCYLAEKGADLYHKNHQGKTPLSIIGDSKTEEVVQEYATGKWELFTLQCQITVNFSRNYEMTCWWRHRGFSPFIHLNCTSLSGLCISFKAAWSDFGHPKKLFWPCMLWTFYLKLLEHK